MPGPGGTTGLRPGDLAANAGLYEEAPTAGLDQLEAGHVAVQEGNDGALGVVVKGRSGLAVGGDSAPLLPHDGRTAVDHDQPWRLGVRQEEFVGEVEVAGVGEHGQ